MQALCINDDVLRLQSASLINERCLELQKPGSGRSKKAAAVAGGGPGNVAAVGPQHKVCTRCCLQEVFDLAPLPPPSSLMLALYNDPALQAAKGVASSSGRCAFLAGGTRAAATTRDMILAQPIDIEELAKLGGWVVQWVGGWVASVCVAGNCSLGATCPLAELQGSARRSS
jgi:hypothetical protein